MRSLGFRLGIILLATLVFALLYTVKESTSVIKTYGVGSFVNASSSEFTEEPSLSTEKLRSQIMFFGDVMMARDVELHMKRYGASYPFSSFSIDTKNAYAVANFESAVPLKHVSTPMNTFRFSTEKDYLPELNKAGFTHVSLANNHSFDYGLPGYNNTIQEMWNASITPFGHPTVLSTSSVTLIEAENYTVAIIGIHTLFTDPKMDDIKSVLSYAKSISDVQIVYIHWGNEYEENQSAAQRELATTLAEEGVDIIVGHHPHVVQGIEKINQTIVFYSLGNFIFDQYFSSSVQKGLVLNLVLEEEPYLSLLPVTSEDSRTKPSLMSSSTKQVFLEDLSLRSSASLKDEVIAGHIYFDSPLATSSEVVIMTE